MSNLGISGFERYHSTGDDRLPTREDLEQYFVDVFGHKPTKEQLKVFHRLLIDLEEDVDKALDYCEKDECDIEYEK